MSTIYLLEDDYGTQRAFSNARRAAQAFESEADDSELRHDYSGIKPSKRIDMLTKHLRNGCSETTHPSKNGELAVKPIPVE
jgi:hypothetical protein